MKQIEDWKKEFLLTTWLSRCVANTLIEAGSGLVHSELEVEELKKELDFIECLLKKAIDRAVDETIKVKSHVTELTDDDIKNKLLLEFNITNKEEEK